MKSLATREAFGTEIIELGRKQDNVYIVDCDIGKSCKTLEFAKQFPENHVNVGIAEQCAGSIAAGLATIGKIPIISTYAVFGSMRMVEQIRQSICYPNLNVKIACSHGGLTPASDGASHQGIEDMGIMRTLPNMTVIMGADYNATRKLVAKAVEYEGPVYIRFTRDAVPGIYQEDEDFEIGVSKQLREGTDAALIAVGDVLILALRAADKLKEEGIHVSVIDMHTIKPLDEEAVLKAINETGGIVTVEDHNIINGLGSAVSELAAAECKIPLKRIGVKDNFGESGPYQDLLASNGITVENIVETVKELIKK